MKLLYNICDLFVNVNKNDSYYTLFPKERKVFENISCMKLGQNAFVIPLPSDPAWKVDVIPALSLHGDFKGAFQRHPRLGCAKTGETNYDEPESGS